MSRLASRLAASGFLVSCVSTSLVAACGDAGTAGDAPPGREPPISLGAEPDDAGYVEKARVDGGFALADAGVVREDRFVTQVVGFTPGPCAGFGASRLPDIVQGPPEGTGTMQGSFDVVSLGTGGEIILGFGDNAIVDGPGVDFVVFENAFYANGEAHQIAADLAEVSVSEDGETWTAFPCDATAASPPYGTCAGWRPVIASSANGISPFDEAAGGDRYDLATVGVTRARFVRIRDLFRTTCPDGVARPNNYGFDLDAIAIVNAAVP